MKLLHNLPLRQLLTLPYVVLVLGVALVIGGLNYIGGQRAVNDLSGQLLRETASRIALATKEHIAGAKGVLEAAFPVGVLPPEHWSDAELAAMRERFWIATSIHRNPHNYAFYGDIQGRFFGLMREANDSAELRVRRTGTGVRTLYGFKGIHGPLDPGKPESKVFDPRQRPWLDLGLKAERNTWSPIYIDFRTEELVTTFVRRVVGADGRAQGVVATDLPLQRVSDFLGKLTISPHALAMVVEPDGHLVGTSEGSPLGRDTAGEFVRLSALDAGNPLAAATFKAVQADMNRVAASEARTSAFTAANGETMHVGYTQLRDDSGLDWWVLVMVPRSDFMGAVDRSAWHSALLSVLAALAAAGVGWGVLRVVGRMLGRFVESAQLVGQGQPTPPLPVRRADELGVLARSLTEMQTKLQTDTLTGLMNRDTFIRTLQDRFLRYGDGVRPEPFALLFVDVNRFKTINDTLGHVQGDAVLKEVAQRLRQQMRGGDLVARYAGDEFVVLLDALRHPDDAEAVRSELEAVLRQPMACVVSLNTELAELGSAVGVAVCPNDAAEIGDLIAHADADMYRRKAQQQQPR